MLDVGNADIGDDTHHRLCRVAQVLDLILGAHAHFHHRYLSFGGNAHQCFGRADLVILVALGFDDAEGGGHHCRYHFLGGGFAHAAGDAYHLGRHFGAVQRGDFQERPQTALYPQYLLCWGVVAVMLGHRRFGPCRQRPVDVVVAIHPFPGQRNKKRPGAGFPTIGDHTGDLSLRRLGAAQLGGYFSQ